MVESDPASEKLVESNGVEGAVAIVSMDLNKAVCHDSPMTNGACVGDEKGLKASSGFAEEGILLRLPLKPGAEDDSAGENLPSPIIAGPSPPDGGIRAVVVMIAAFLCNGIIFGTINSSGVLFEELKNIYREQGSENPASAASIPFSLAIGTTFFLSMVAGVFTDRFGIMSTTVTGGAIATLGMFLSSMYYMRSDILIITFGLVFGTGASLAYTPSLVILGHYWNKRLGLVNGFVTAGSSVFTIAITQVLKTIIKTKGLQFAYQMLALMTGGLIICGSTFKPYLPDAAAYKDVGESMKKKSCKKRCRNFLNNFINFEIWKNKRYVIWTLAIPSALFGYFVPYVHLVAYAKETLGKDVNSEYLVQCIGLTSGLGRIVFGLIADFPSINRIFLQQISFFCIGSLTLLLTTANYFWILIVISLGMGLFDGCFISLLGPIAFDIVGPTGASQAIGCLLGLCSIPLTLGPYIAGVLHDKLGSYFVPFICAGIPPIIGGFVLGLIRFVKEPPKGAVGSPARDSGEIKNNLSANANPSQPEAEALMMDADNQEILQVDVRRLVNLQRESSV